MNETRVVIEPSHPSLAGHFPGDPIVPAALLMDHALSFVETSFARRVVAVATAKFLSPVRPQQTVVISIRSNDDDHATVTGTVDSTTAFTLSIVLQRQDV
jgi:3-hydroxymyristoyl/3-hydroxydecanoyl-(acyl carrier protein) dehydratase